MNTTQAMASTLALPRDRAENNTHGVICASNASRFEDSHLSQPLTRYAAGWKDPNNNMELLNRAVPEVPVGRRFQFKKAKNHQAFLLDTDDERGVGASFKRVEYDGEIVDSSLKNHGLTIPLDKDEVNADDPAVQRTYVDRLMARLYRNSLYRLIVALDSIDTADSVTWNPAPGGTDNIVNPHTALRAAVQNYLKDTTAEEDEGTGILPNRLLFGNLFWNYYLDVAEAHRGALRPADSPEALAARLGLDRAIVIPNTYATTTQKKKLMLAATAFIYFAEDGVGQDDPSNIKRFTLQGATGPRVHIEDHPKRVDISVEHYERLVITGGMTAATSGVRKLTVTQS